MKRQNVSDAVIRRLPRYYRYLDDLHIRGTVRISSSTLGCLRGTLLSKSKLLQLRRQRLIPILNPNCKRSPLYSTWLN